MLPMGRVPQGIFPPIFLVLSCLSLLVTSAPEIHVPPVKMTLSLTRVYPSALYAIPIWAGTPAQGPLPVVADTGSGDLMIFDAPMCEEALATSSESASYRLHCMNHTASTSMHYVHSPKNVYGLRVDNRWPTVHNMLNANDWLRFASGVPEAKTTAAPYELGSALGTMITENSKSITRREITLTYWNNTAGTLGMSFAGLTRHVDTPFNTLLKNVTARHLVTFDVRSFRNDVTINATALALGAAGDDARLLLGGLDDSEGMLWTHGHSMTTPMYHDFPLFHLSLCGESLFKNYASNWFAMMDTGAECLSVPADFFDMIMSWLPSDCVRPIQHSYHQICYYSGLLEDIDRLPALTFRVSETGPELKIPVKSLLVQEGNRLRYCIVSAKAIDPRSPLYPPTISLGAIALRSLLTVLDYDNGRVGFKNQRNALSDAVDQEQPSLCAEAVQCDGSQSRDGSRNVCRDPECEKFYFQEVNTSSHNCQWTMSFKLMTVTIVILLAIVELLFNELYTKIKQASENFFRRGRPVPP